MSQERFIRCPHCRLPHEATESVCPMTGKAIELQPRKKDPAPPPSDRPRWTTPVPDPMTPVEMEASPSVTRMFGLTIDGKYRLDELIGRGGMGVVYKGEHVGLGREVAVKVLLRGHEAGSAAKKRFQREARAAGTIGHPNIVQVFDLGTLPDGVPYIVMELLEGENLADRLSIRGALDLTKSCHIVAQALAGLGAVHESNIIHRDLKPDNIFLTPGGVKLVDFGISKTIDENTMSLTRTGVVVGTPYYLAPEQARGQRDIDHRVDLWSAGVVLYECLTGMLPFHAGNYNALLAKILSVRPEPPSSLRPAIGEGLDRVVMKALAFAPEDRYQSALEMKEAVEKAALSPRGAGESQVVSDVLAEARKQGRLDASTVSLKGKPPDDPTEVSDSFILSDLKPDD